MGRVVMYTLTDDDKLQHGCNEASEAPATITRVFDDGKINVKVSLDGPDTIWRTSVLMGDSPGQWRWPTIVPARVG